MGRAHALAIDDNVQNLRILSQMLAKYGVSCTELSDADNVIEVLPSLPRPDLIFLDLEMRKVDGFQAKDILRPLVGNTPIIACTVHVSEMHVVRRQGFDGFIGKPLDPDKFADQLERILNGDAVWDRT